VPTRPGSLGFVASTSAGGEQEQLAAVGGGGGFRTRDELPADQRDGFADLDTNKDGKLSADELKQHAERMIYVPVPVPVEIVSLYVVEGANGDPTLAQLQETYDMLRKANANNDGKITKDECPDCMTAMFKRADKNGDGAITKQDLMECCKAAFKDDKSSTGDKK